MALHFLSHPDQNFPQGQQSSPSVWSRAVAASHLWLSRTSKVASAPEKLDFTFYLISII